MFTVRLSLSFQRAYKRLVRKYRQLPNDLAPLIQIIEAGDFSAHDAVKGFAHKIYKARVRSAIKLKVKAAAFGLFTMWSWTMRKYFCSPYTPKPDKKI